MIETSGAQGHLTDICSVYVKQEYSAPKLLPYRNVGTEPWAYSREARNLSVKIKPPCFQTVTTHSKENFKHFVGHITSNGWVSPEGCQLAWAMVQTWRRDPRRKLVFQPGNWGQEWGWGMLTKRFPMKGIIFPPIWTQETELMTNFKFFFFLSTFYFLFLTLWKTWLTYNLG